MDLYLDLFVCLVTHEQEVVGSNPIWIFLLILVVTLYYQSKEQRLCVSFKYET